MVWVDEVRRRSRQVEDEVQRGTSRPVPWATLVFAVRTLSAASRDQEGGTADWTRAIAEIRRQRIEPHLLDRIA